MVPTLLAYLYDNNLFVLEFISNVLNQKSKISKSVIISLILENFEVLCQIVRDYGDFTKIWIGPDLNILMSNPKDVEVSYGTSIRKSSSSSNFFFA